MATPAAIQAELDAVPGGVHINQSTRVNAEIDEHYAVGTYMPYQGKAKFIRTASAETAAMQAATILEELVL